MTNFEASVVIGFRDWGADRIRRSAQSVLDSFDGISAECIISDYGSADPEPARKVANELSIGYVYTSDDIVWSRSRALNAGFAIATGDIFISTDADMLFSPRAMRRIVETAKEAEDCALFLQCRDLPQDMGDDYFAYEADINWSYLERNSRLRPRWGMGGMMAIHADGFAAIRGFDERLHTYGGEDLDFARRAQRAGYRTVWVDEPEVRMYHMWHPPTIKNVEQTDAGRKAVAFNRNVVYNDKTYIRNITHWKHKPTNIPPLVSFAIATRDRPNLLEQSIRSVLTQSVSDFELLIIDDGSSDDSSAHVVEGFQDSRLRYIRREAQGISAARNTALDLSRGQFTAVMDDDDLIPPRRLESQLAAITGEYVGSVGSFVNFDDQTGQTNLIVSKVPTIEQAVEQGGAPGHGTWLIRTDVMQTIRYDESITSGVDNNFFLRLLRSGYRIAHCGKPVLLRRQHKAQVTNTDSSNQGNTATQALKFIRFGLTETQLKTLADESVSQQYPQTSGNEEAIEAVRAYLPDSLVRRCARVRLTATPPSSLRFDGDSSSKILTRDGVQLESQLVVRDASYRDLVTLTTIGSDLSAHVVDTETSQGLDEEHWITQALKDFLEQAPEHSIIQIAAGSPKGAAAHKEVSVYEMNDGTHTATMTFRNLATANMSMDDPKPWLEIGRTAEEYWT